MDDAQQSSRSFLHQLQDNGPASFVAISRRSRREWALYLATCLLLVVTLVMPYLTYSDLPLTGEGSSERQIGYMLVLALAIYGARPAIARWKLIAMPIPVLLALGWCWLSIAWAIAPDIAVRRLLLTTLVVWTAFLLVQQMGYRSTLDIMRGVLVVALVANYITVFVDPLTGIHMMKDASMSTALIGNWRGFLVHKNNAGAICAITIIIFLFDAKHISRSWRFGVILLAGYFLFRSQSKTSAGMVVLASMAGATFIFYSRRFRNYAVPAIVILASLGWMILSAYKDILIFNYLAPSSFTGRGYIWNMLVRYAIEHPLTGAGFGSFWDIGAYSPVYQYGTGFLTQLAVGHNGYLDLLVTVGIPGLLLSVFALVVWPLWTLLADETIKPQEGALIAAMLIFCIGHNVTESSLFARDTMVGVFLLLTVAFTRAVAGRRVRKTKRSQAGDDLMRIVKARG